MKVRIIGRAASLLPFLLLALFLPVQASAQPARTAPQPLQQEEPAERAPENAADGPPEQMIAPGSGEEEEDLARQLSGQDEPPSEPDDMPSSVEPPLSEELSISREPAANLDVPNRARISRQLRPGARSSRPEGGWRGTGPSSSGWRTKNTLPTQNQSSPE